LGLLPNPVSLLTFEDRFIRVCVAISSDLHGKSNRIVDYLNTMYQER